MEIANSTFILPIDCASFFTTSTNFFSFLSAKRKKGICCRLLAQAFSTQVAIPPILFEPSKKKFFCRFEWVRKIFLLDGTVKKRTSFKKRSAAIGSVFILWHCISLIGFYYFSVRYKSTIKALTSHKKKPDQSTDTCSCRRPADCHPACAAAMRKICSLWPPRQAMTLPAWDIFCFSHVAPISRSFVAKFLWHSGRCLFLTPLTASASAESTIETFLGIFYASLRKPPISHSSRSSRQNFCDTRVAVCFDFVTAVHYAGSRE